jgi:hypothetical protein
MKRNVSLHMGIGIDNPVKIWTFYCSLCCRRHWPRGLRRESAGACLLGLRVWIPRGHGCLSVVSVVCCQVEVTASSWSLVQRSPTECVVSECDLGNSWMRGSWPTRCWYVIKKFVVFLTPCGLVGDYHCQELLGVTYLGFATCNMS